jgi:hypothetical protein
LRYRRDSQGEERDRKSNDNRDDNAQPPQASHDS